MRLLLVVLGLAVALAGSDGVKTAQVKRLECVTPEVVELEVSSDDLFPVRDALIELHLGPVVSGLSRYPDGGDLHTLIFELTLDELANVSASDAVTVRFNPGSAFDTWEVGQIDPATAAGCAPAGRYHGPGRSTHAA